MQKEPGLLSRTGSHGYCIMLRRRQAKATAPQVDQSAIGSMSSGEVTAS